MVMASCQSSISHCFPFAQPLNRADQGLGTVVLFFQVSAPLGLSVRVLGEKKEFGSHLDLTYVDGAPTLDGKCSLRLGSAAVRITHRFHIPFFDGD